MPTMPRPGKIRNPIVRGGAGPRPGSLVVSCAVMVLATLLSPGCEDNAADPGGPPPAVTPSVSFTLNAAPVEFSGSGVWPPSGIGVVAGMDTAGKTLQVTGYRQTSGKGSALSAPEPRFNILFFEVRDTAGLSAGVYHGVSFFLGLDMALSEADSTGYVGSDGSVTLSALSGNIVEGTFSGSALREGGSDTAVVSGGMFTAVPREGLFFLQDTGSTGGTIAVNADTGTVPVYSWTGGPVNALTVARVSDLNAVVWGVVIAGEDSIASGVVHGNTPSGALRTDDAELVLTPGVLYRVRVSRTDGEYGYVNFTP